MTTVRARATIARMPTVNSEVEESNVSSLLRHVHGQAKRCRLHHPSTGKAGRMRSEETEEGQSSQIRVEDVVVQFDAVIVEADRVRERPVRRVRLRCWQTFKDTDRLRADPVA